MRRALTVYADHAGGLAARLTPERPRHLVTATAQRAGGRRRDYRAGRAELMRILRAEVRRAGRAAPGPGHEAPVAVAASRCPPAVRVAALEAMRTMPVAWRATVLDLDRATDPVLDGSALLALAWTEHLTAIVAELDPRAGLRVVGRREEQRRRRAALHAAVRTAAEAQGRPWIVEFARTAVTLELALADFAAWAAYRSREREDHAAAGILGERLRIEELGPRRRGGQDTRG